MKIFDFLVHEGHQYEFSKLGCDITIALDSQAGKFWDEKARPVPTNVSFVDKSELSVTEVEKYDVAIIRNYKQFQFLKDCSLPKVIVMHCSKHGQGDPEFLKEDLSDYSIVFCSHADKKRWNIPTGRQYVIYPGLDPDEWPVSTRAVNKLFTVARNIKERDKYLGYSIVREFERSNILVKVVGGNPALRIQPPESFDEFRKFHSKYAVYLNSTLKSPMPRGRVEAMMSGIPVVSTNFYDEEEFIEHGVSGFLSNDVQRLKEYAVLLLNDKQLQQKMAEETRKTAIELFHIDRFLSEWKQVLQDTTHTDSIEGLNIKTSKSKIYMTRKDSSGGGGTVTSNNVVEGLRRAGFSVSCLDINSKGWVSFVDGVKLPASGERVFDNYIKKHPCDTLIFDDMARYTLCKDSIDEHTRVFLCLLGNPQVHPEHWIAQGVLDLDQEHNNIQKILCRPVYAKFLRPLFGDDRVISWIGGCDGDQMREQYGVAQYRHPKDGALILSAHRGTDWWKNPSTAFLAAYGIHKRYPETIYFKPSGNSNESSMLKHAPFDVQYGGTQKEGMDRDELLKSMACAQLALEPGYSEGFSRSCNEMMNLGVPVIQGPNAQHIRENDFLAQHLLLKDGSDIQEMVDKSLALLENKELWEEVSQQCIQFSSQFNTQQEVDTLLQALQESK